MYETLEKAGEGIAALGLPIVFLDIFRGGGPARFCVQYDAPKRFFQIRTELLTSMPAVEKLIPLLEMNREVIYAYDTDSRTYVEYYYGDSELRFLGSNYQQLIGSLFVDLGYAGLESLVEEVSPLFEFRHLDQFRDFLATDDEAIDSQEAKLKFVSALE